MIGTVTGSEEPRGNGKYGGGKYAGDGRRAHAPGVSIIRNVTNNVSYAEAQASFKNRLIASGREESSIETAIGHVEMFGRWLASKGLGHRDVRAGLVDEYLVFRRTHSFVKDQFTKDVTLQEKGAGDNTRRRDVIYIKALWKHMLRERMIGKNPLTDYELPKVDQADIHMPTALEIGMLLNAIARKCKAESNPCRRHRNLESERFFTPRDQALIVVGVATGLRISEVLALTPADYDSDERVFRIHKSKTGKPREVSIDPEAIRFIDAWLRVRPNEDLLRKVWAEKAEEAGDKGRHAGSPTLFVADNGHRMKQNYWSRTFKRYCEHAGLKDVTYHCLRHYHITQVLHIDAYSAKEQGGHKDFRTTMGTYGHIMTKKRAAAVEIAAPFGKVLDAMQPKRRRSLIGMR